MTQKNIPSRAELIRRTFNTRCQQENDLFHNFNANTCFWKFSDLAILYPQFFDMKKLASQKTIHTIQNMVIDTIPEFSQLTEQPVHILTVKEPYNIYNPETNRIRAVKNGTDQHLTNVACEYLFRQQNGAELEQAYFLAPKTPDYELVELAQNLRFEKIRTQIAQTSNLLSAIINRAHNADKSSFSKIWSLIWETLYKVKSMDTLRERHNIKTSPIDYMKPQTVTFINAMLQEIVLNFANRPFYTIADVYNLAKIKATLARVQFIKYGSTPEKQLTEKSTCSVIEKIKRTRKNFWWANYPKSLQQR